MSLDALIKSTNAYKIIESEKRSGLLSHAYLLLCDDGEYLREYLKIFAKLIMSDGDPRTEKLIDKECYADCTVYPKDRTNILTADIDELVEASFIKPLENAKRMFVLCGSEDINAAAQNKLLKTLEEPPENVVILIGAVNEYSLLPTIKSRVMKLEIPPFTAKSLKEALIDDYSDEDRLKTAIDLSGGKASAAVKAYESGAGEDAFKLAKEVLSALHSSRDVIKFVDKIDKDNIDNFITALKQEVGETLKLAIKNGEKQVNGFTVGALIAIEDMLDKKRAALYYNANVAMTVDGILFGLAEEKYRWQKL